MSKIDYDKTYETASNQLGKVEEKVVKTFKSNVNFIGNVRKYIVNEFDYFESVVVYTSIKITLAFIALDLVFMYLFKKSSILGLPPKLITLAILVIYVYKRGGNLNGKIFKKFRKH